MVLVSLCGVGMADVLPPLCSPGLGTESCAKLHIHAEAYIFMRVSFLYLLPTPSSRPAVGSGLVIGRRPILLGKEEMEGFLLCKGFFFLSFTLVLRHLLKGNFLRKTTRELT